MFSEYVYFSFYGRCYFQKVKVRIAVNSACVLNTKLSEKRQPEAHVNSFSVAEPWPNR